MLSVIQANQVDADLVETLRDLLAKAESRDLRSLVYAGSLRGSILSGHVLPAGSNVFEIIGGIERVKANVLANCIE